MKILEKYNNEKILGFDWLNIDYLPDSNGYNFEIYLNESKDLVSESIIIFHLLFQDYVKNILIKPFGQEVEWGNFCIDTWDIKNDSYDYSLKNKKEPTMSYLKMLIDNEIDPEYKGYCKCSNWSKFLHIILHCNIQHIAPYSMLFFEPKNNFIFYFHYSGSFGIYYKELNKSITNIIQKCNVENLEIKNISDERVLPNTT